MLKLFFLFCRDPMNPTKSAKQSIFDGICIFILGLMCFTFGLSHQEIIGFEARFYLFALEMFRHGISWFPMTYHHPYPDYPVTSTLFIYGLSQVMGGLNKGVAV